MEREKIKEALLIAKEKVSKCSINIFLCYHVADALYMIDDPEVNDIIENGHWKSDFIRRFIPEFTPEFLAGFTPESKSAPWWDPDDRESRLKALDKLIKIYS